MDVAALAKEIALFLAPYTPYLLEAGKKVSEGIAGKVGEDAWDQVKYLWGKLRSKIESKPAALEAVRDVAAAPEKEQAQNSLAWQLEKLLGEDPALAAELDKWLSDGKSAGRIVIASGDRSVAIGGGVKRSVIIAGDGNKVSSSGLDEL